MASGKSVDRKVKLAAALKQNLKRRKGANSGAGKDSLESSQDLGLGAGVAAQKGLKSRPRKVRKPPQSVIN